MLKENWRLISRIERVADAILIVLCFFVAYYSRDYVVWLNSLLSLSLPFQGPDLAPIKDYFIVLFVGLVGFLSSLHLQGAYRSMRLTSGWHLVRISLFSGAFVFVALSAVLFSLKIDLSRSFIGLFCGLVAASLSVERFVVLRLLRAWRRQGMNFRNIVVCGVGDQALRLTKEILSRPELGIRIRAFCVLAGASGQDASSGPAFRDELRAVGLAHAGKLLQGVEALHKALREYAIDEVIFTDVIEVMPQVEAAVVACTDQGVRTTIAADLFSVGIVQSGLSYFGGIPLIHFQTPPGDRWELTVKRMIDLVGSVVVLAILSPLFLIISILIRLDSRGPIIFRQTRVGLNGRLFTMFKFRSMHVDAESRLAEVRHLNEMTGPVFKLRDDPRITRVGGWLRRLSLDELPQFWNVVRGDMSLVGPRPPIPGEVSMYNRKDRRRLSMRPGITCTWQVGGRNEIADFESWVKLDLEYIDNWSLSRDLLLLLKTIPAVLRGTGAR